MFSAELPLLPVRPSAMIVTAAAYAEIYAIIRASIQDDSFQQACRTHPALQGLDADTLVRCVHHYSRVNLLSIYQPASF